MASDSFSSDRSVSLSGSSASISSSESSQSFVSSSSESSPVSMQLSRESTPIHVSSREPTPEPQPTPPTPRTTRRADPALQAHIDRVHRSRIAKRSPRKRINKLQKRCAPCKKFIQNAQWNSHVNGIVHRRAVQRHKDLLEIPSCNVCERIFCSKHDLSTHLLSRGHLKELRRLDEATIVE